MANDDNRADAPDEAWAVGLEVLLDLAATVIEDAHETGVAAIAPDRTAQRARIDVLRQAGADLIILANACEVLARREHE